jgi:hypothetical protein
MIQFSSSFAENISYSDLKMSHLNQMQSDAKPQKQSTAKNSNFSASGSSSNTSNNGVYVDLGKSLLEAAKCGETEKVQECIKNGAPFITDWVNVLLFFYVNTLIHPLSKIAHGLFVAGNISPSCECKE